MLYRILKSGFIDRLAYISAILSALWWFVNTQYPYPSAIAGFLKEISPLYSIVFASFTGGLLIAKYVFIDNYSRLIKKIKAEKEELEKIIQELKDDIAETKKERNFISERERCLKDRLNNFEEKGLESHLTELRRRIRLYEDDKKTALNFLIRDLKEHLNELGSIHEEEVVHAAIILKKEIELLDNEVKRGEKSYYELILKIADIRENIFDLVVLSVSSTEREYGYCGFPWATADTNPSRLEHAYKFLKVAFHPDRFSSATLKEEAKMYFQQTIQAYNAFKERLKTSS